VPQALGSIRPYLFLLVLCLGLYLPGLFTLPPIDRDEALFAQASRQMLEDDDFVRIQFQERSRHKKPVGIYWLQALAVKLTGTLDKKKIWPYRLPSQLGATLAVFSCLYFGKRLFNGRTAFLAAGLLASSLLLVVEAHQATTDAMLLAFIMIAQGALALVYISSQRQKTVSAGVAMAFWIAQGVGILLKGPMITLVSVLTIGCLVAADRKIRWLWLLRPIWGFPLVLLIVSPWMISIYQATGGAFFADAVGSDLLPKIFSGQESHGAPPGYYIFLLMLTFWPGSLFVWPALWAARKQRQTWHIRFCLAWIIPNWILFELLPTKLPHYVMPTYPAIALLTAWAVERVVTGEIALMKSKLARVGYWAWCIAALFLVGTIVGGTRYLTGGFPLPLILPLVTVGFLVITLRRHIIEHDLRKILISAMVGTVFVVGPIFQYVLPGIEPLWLSRTIAETVEEISQRSPAKPVRVAAVGYHEPSLVFLCGTETELTSPEGAAVFLAEPAPNAKSPHIIAVVTDDHMVAFNKNMEQLNHQVRQERIIRGFNYTKGRWETLHLFTSKSLFMNSR